MEGRLVNSLCPEMVGFVAFPWYQKQKGVRNPEDGPCIGLGNEAVKYKLW